MPHGFVADVDAALEQQSPTFSNDSAKRTYIITTGRIASGDELKRNGLDGLTLYLRVLPCCWQSHISGAALL